LSSAKVKIQFWALNLFLMSISENKLNTFNSMKIYVIGQEKGDLLTEVAA
jgi:hypothetical protein